MPTSTSSTGTDLDITKRIGVGASYALVDPREPDQHVREHYLNLGTSFFIEDRVAVGVRGSIFAQQVRGETMTTGARSVFEGLPIATGVIEGACRHLVQDRMGRTGARWSLLGAEAVLRLRALRSSNDFDDYWQFHLAKEHERNHTSRYTDGIVPDPIPQPRPNLTVVN